MNYGLLLRSRVALIAFLNIIAFLVKTPRMWRYGEINGQEGVPH